MLEGDTRALIEDEVVLNTNRSAGPIRYDSVGVEQATGAGRARQNAIPKV